ncbi:MAG: glutamine--fructose-6-phosphate transaminase (isomerizing), partial [Actinobacteria bacterium]|nr:glutamine--fructose-6-phosphate transaminase (isomerizing) [Actinomycetota bacterium]
MCGIVGYAGDACAKDILLKGLHKLEYRGYDSAGIALLCGNGDMDVICRVGKVGELDDAIEGMDLRATVGIGHTRWATHGRPSEENAHPHCDCSGRIAVVHNGIIENYLALKEELISQGHIFRSETDTEVIAHLLERYYNGDLLEAMRLCVTQIHGAYGLAAVCADEPDRIVVTRRDSPIVVGSGNGQAVVASDIPAIIDITRDVVYLDDDQFAVLHKGGEIKYYGPDGKEVSPVVSHIDWDTGAAERGGYPDFMLKEIHEQPRVVRDTLAGRLHNGEIVLDELALSKEELDAIERIYIIACGTSYHAGLVARTLIEEWARIPVAVEVASEFRYRNPIITPRTLVIAITQSGETADTLAAMRIARNQGAKVFAVTNVVGSRAARESDGVIYAKAGIEIGVAATKSFIAQLVAVSCLALFFGAARGGLTKEQVSELFSELEETAPKIERVFDDETPIQRAAEACKDAHSAMFIGRGMGAAVCYEGALKLKEISYLHAEAYAAGEIKHGPIALIDENVPVVAIAAQSAT